ncbi:chromate transporter [Polynucleobacter sp. MWH-Loch1C5]|jgi:chromate transporter|uniref:chromate transporter n=1 Tax=Polynucleobacter sp. MWH-Loch1C5 TaxID=2689108 RepID=UPI001C0D12FB|nr:chromate transporter [Polynucleobacter sp. MWH-Loch1C5]MBU3543121.1 chromate transporter [Polynucleobacter sp. MWH-Loch1C5]
MRAQPRSKTELFWAFTQLSLQGFGGVLPVAQRELVEKRAWFTRAEFLEEWAVAQVLPGPNIVNLSIIFGARYFGFWGGLAGLAGMLLFPMLVLIVIAMLYLQLGDRASIEGALRGMGAVAAGLIAGTSLKLATALRQHPLGPWLTYGIAVLCFVLIALLRVPLLYVLLFLGGSSILATYWVVKKSNTQRQHD